jgi:PAS domain S-box-containing protein
MQFWTLIKTYILEIAAVVGALIFIWKSILVPFGKRYKQLTNIYDNLEKTMPIITNLANDFKPNGGNSLRDVINRIDKNTEGANSRLWITLELTPHAYYESDETGKYVKANKNWSQLNGLQLTEALGYGWINSVKEDERERVREEWNLALVQLREFDLFYKLNSDIMVHNRAYPIKTIKGDVLGWVGVIIKV